ncbi:hypothetical protein JL722_5356 [Aureococcus anophagefferens]|nr:hypothetical protein JL722_5356 [Aureococcus anophagefferens]
MEKLPISLVLSCGDVVIRIKLPHGDKLGAVARVGDVFEDGDNVTVSVGDDKPSPAPRAAPGTRRISTTRALLATELRNLGLAALVVAPDAPLDAAAFVPGQKGRTWFDPLLRVRRDRAADPFAHGTPCDGVAHLAAVLQTFDVPPARAAAAPRLRRGGAGAPYGGVFLLGSALDDDALAFAVAFGALEAPPFLFAHGADDRRCPPETVAASAARVEARLGAAVTRTEHAGLAHHISPAMLAGVAAFVKACLERLMF